MPTLSSLGWSPFFEATFAPLRELRLIPARVAVEHRRAYVLYTEAGELAGEAAGKLYHGAGSAADLPKVGDWVAVSPLVGEPKAIIRQVLPRRTKFSRKAAGEHDTEQVIAANIDRLFIVQGLDHDFNLRRLERYLVMAWESGAEPVILLNKADLCGNVEEYTGAVAEIAPGVPVIAISAREGLGIEELGRLLREGETVAFIGSSGVGKSTLINRLLGADHLKTAEVRAADSRGRHTTTHRELFLLPGGGLVIDTPGLRELQLWYSEQGLDETFADIEELARNCHFADCTHSHESKCAVLEALRSGSLSQARYASYQKLLKEMSALEARTDRRAKRKKQKKIKLAQKEFYRIAGKKKT
jgi:ribosome biogenesis GTPase